MLCIGSTFIPTLLEESCTLVSFMYLYNVHGTTTCTVLLSSPPHSSLCLSPSHSYLLVHARTLYMHIQICTHVYVCISLISSITEVIMSSQCCVQAALHPHSTGGELYTRFTYVCTCTMYVLLSPPPRICLPLFPSLLTLTFSYVCIVRASTYMYTIIFYVYVCFKLITSII